MLHRVPVASLQDYRAPKGRSAPLPITIYSKIAQWNSTRGTAVLPSIVIDTLPRLVNVTSCLCQWYLVHHAHSAISKGPFVPYVGSEGQLITHGNQSFR